MARTELSNIFGNDLDDIIFVTDAVMDESGEYYAFVSCSNYELYADKLIRNSAVVRVVPSYEEPHQFTDTEVEDFSSSAKNASIFTDFAMGDIILVKEGYLKGLYGIVTKCDKENCEIRFRFYTKSFPEILPVTDVEFVDSIFRNLKFPVVKNGLKNEDFDIESQEAASVEAVGKVGNGGNIRWKSDRKYKGDGS